MPWTVPVPDLAGPGMDRGDAGLSQTECSSVRTRPQADFGVTLIGLAA